MKHLRKFLSVIFLFIFTNISFSSEINYRIFLNEKGEELAEILIRGKPVITVSEKEGFSSLKEKAEVIYQRLVSLRTQGLLKPENIKMGIYKNKVIISVKEFLLITVLEKEAQKQNLTPLELGKLWENNLKQALTLPTLIIPFKQIEVPLYEEKTFSISGTAKGEVYFDYNRDLLDVQFDSYTNQVKIRGLLVGKTILSIKREGISVSLEVIVKKYAGYIFKTGQVILTGNSISKELLKEAVLRETKKCVFREENSYSYILEEKINFPQEVNLGEEIKIKVPLKIEGEGYIPFKGEVEVKVTNEPLPFQDAECLLLSNFPENIYKEGNLAEYVLTEETPLRLLYHHRNSTKMALEFIILLINEEDTPKKIHLIKGEAGPSLAEIYTGYLAGYKFFNNYLNNTGEIIEIPAHSWYALTQRRMPHSTVLSGVFQIRMLDKGRIYLLVKAQSSYLPANISLGDIEENLFPHLQLTRKGVYPSPKLFKEYEYVVDSKWCFIGIGDDPLLSGEGRKLLGNYGVIYDINLKIVNPTPYFKRVKLYFSPAGGPSQGIFLIDGKLKITKLLNHENEEEIENFLLKPHQKKIVQIKTMPLAGMNYPVRIVVRR